MPYNSRDIIARLEQEGFRQIRQRGSHVQLRHEETGRRVTVPHPKRDLPRGTVRSIEKQSGVVLIPRRGS